MSTEGTRYFVDENDLLHLLVWQEHARDLHLPQCGMCGLVSRCTQDLRLPDHAADAAEMLLRPPLTSVDERCIRLDFTGSVHQLHRIVADETRHHERWLRLHPRAPRKVN